MCVCLYRLRKITTSHLLDKIRKHLKPFSRKEELSEDTRSQCHLICLTNKNTKNSKMYCRKTRMTLRNVLKREDRPMIMIKLMLMKNLISLGRKTKLTVQFITILSKLTWWACKINLFMDQEVKDLESRHYQSRGGLQINMEVSQTQATLKIKVT